MSSLKATGRKPLLILALLALWGPLELLASGTTTIGWQSNDDPFTAGYRLYLGESSGEYTESFDVGNVTEFELSEIKTGHEYYCAISTLNVFGFESVLSNEIVIAVLGPDGNANEGRLILLEAENGAVSGPLSVGGSGDSSWLEATDSSESGEVTFDFDVSVAGDYLIWCRVQAESNASDSFYYSVDGADEEVFHIYGTANPSGTAIQSGWIWRAISVDGASGIFPLDEGVHTLRLRGREASTRIDRIVLSSEPNFVPIDALPRSGDFFLLLGSSGSTESVEGDGATLWARTLSVEEIDFQWFYNGVAIEGANEAYLYIPETSIFDAGEYTLEVRKTSDGSLSSVSAFDFAVAEIPFLVNALERLSDSQVNLSLQGAVRRQVEVQASSTLDSADWTSLGTYQNDSGSVEVLDPDAANHACRFYRVTVTD